MSTAPIVSIPPSAPGTGPVFLPSKKIVQPQSESEKTEEQKEAEAQAREQLGSDIDQEIKRQQDYIKIIDDDFNEAVATGDRETIKLIQRDLKLARGELAQLNATKNAVEDEDKFSMNDLATLLLGASAGMSIVESVDRMLNGEDDGKSFTEQFLERTELATNPEIRQKIIDASYGDARALTDLEGLTSFGNQFGSLSNDMFNGQYGAVLEQAYQKFINTEGNPQIDRDQFLVEYAKQNPTDPISREVQQKISRVGMLEKSSSMLGDIDRNLIREGFADAGKFYQSADQGGYGFTPDMLRSPEQSQVVENALGLMDSPSQDLLEQRLTQRVKSDGKLDDATLRQITDDALGSTGYFADQTYLKSGGAGQAILNTGREMRARMLQDENSLFALLQGQRSYAPVVSNVVGTNTVDPIKAMGLSGSNTGMADQIYRTNPTQGLDLTGNAIPYDANTGGVQPSTSSELRSIGNDLLTIGNL